MRRAFKRRRFTRRAKKNGRRLSKRNYNSGFSGYPGGALTTAAGAILGTIKGSKGPSFTKTGSNKLAAPPNQIGTGVFRSKVTWGRFRKSDPKVIKTITPKYTRVDQAGARLESAIGLQGIYGTGINLFTPKDLQTMSGVTTDATSPVNLYIKGGSIKLMGTNASNHNIRVTFYNITSKRSLGPEHWPLTDWNDGYADQGLTAAALNTVGATPFDVSRFGTNWTIWKQTHFRLSQGESCEFDTTININKMISGVQLWDIVNETAAATANVGAYKAVTQYIVMVIYGYPGHDTGTETLVSLPKIAFDFAYTKKYSYYKQQLLPKATTQVTLFNDTANIEAVNLDTGLEHTIFS